MEGIQLLRLWKQVIVSGRTMRVREREQGRLQGGFSGKTMGRTHRDDIFLKKAGGRHQRGAGRLEGTWMLIVGVMANWIFLTGY